MFPRLAVYFHSDRASPILEALGWHSVTNLVIRRDRVGVFRALRDSRAPEAIRSLFVPRSRVSERATRSSVAGALQLPGFRLSMSRRTFSYRAASAWNSLPPTVSGCSGKSAFISALDKLAS